MPKADKESSITVLFAAIWASGGLYIVGRHECNVHAAADIDAEADVGPP